MHRHRPPSGCPPYPAAMWEYPPFGDVIIFGKRHKYDIFTACPHHSLPCRTLPLPKGCGGNPWRAKIRLRATPEKIIDISTKKTSASLGHVVNKFFVQMAICLIWTTTPKDAVYCVYFIAITRYLFNSARAFSN